LFKRNFTNSNADESSIVMFTPTKFSKYGLYPLIQTRGPGATSLTRVILANMSYINTILLFFKEAYSVSFEIFYPVIFYGNQIKWMVKIRTTKATRSKRKEQSRNKSKRQHVYNLTNHVVGTRIHVLATYAMTLHDTTESKCK
jgi:hypothetical protein